MLRTSCDAEEARWQDANSRFIAVVGAGALKRLQAARVLVMGMSGLGLETAKNLALMGSRLLAIHDDAPVEWSDFSSNFYVTPDQLGKPRAAAVFDKLRELNPRTELKLLSGAVSDAVLEQFTVVVSTNQTREEIEHISEFCHGRGIHFICTRLWGLFGFAFVDLGTKFQVDDATGEPELSQFIGFISADGLVSCTEGKLHGLSDGMTVRIDDVKGATQLNKLEFTVTVKDAKRFYIVKPGETLSMSAYDSGGVWTEVKKATHLDFRSWRQFTTPPLNQGECLTVAWGEAKVPAYYHTMQALLAFESQHRRRPAPGSDADAAAVLAAVQPQALAGAEAAANEAFVRTVARQAAGNLNAMATFFGGLVAQEAMKACSGKFSPLRQAFFFDALDVLPDEPLSAEEVAPAQGRYDGQIAIFGRKICDDLHNARFFLVGSGALGCEMLKNWAMIGLGTGPKGHVTVTDMDSIELSNLNRQFLFREKHLKQMKSQVAAAAAREMNPDMQITAWITKVAPDTESVYNAAFWESLTGVCNALDNVNARRYVDGRCVTFRKPLLESGTLGPKGNTQVILPNLTESYTDSVDPPETEIATCLIHTFPNLIQHTLQWARELFETKFIFEPETCINYLQRDNFLATVAPISKENTLRIIVATLQHPQRNFDECIHWARVLFDASFDLGIQSILYFFPPDFVDKDNGLPFWLPPKRPPTPAIFNADNATHLGFVVAATFLRAYTLGLIDSELRAEGYAERKAHIRVVAAAIPRPMFVPNEADKKNIKIKDAPAPEEDAASVDERVMQELAAQLPTPAQARATAKLRVIEFEKDDDRNFHIDFIHAASNVRAEQYKITPVDRLGSKLIAGRIIPAIVTTTAAVTGLVCLELFKLIQGKRKLESYRNSTLTLAAPALTQAEPLPPKKMRAGQHEWTKWDHIDVRATKTEQMTLQLILDQVKASHGCDIDTVQVPLGPSKVLLVYATWNKDSATVCSEPLAPLLQRKNVPEPLAIRPLTLAVSGVLPDGTDCDLPPVFVWWP